MTFVGKILVILIMAFSLVFLGISTVVFTTATNWKDKSAKQADEIKKVTGQLNDAKAKSTAAEGQLNTAKDEQKKQLDTRDLRIADLEKQVKDAEGEMTQARSQFETAQQTAKVALAEATARKGEIEALIETQSKAQAQANQFSAQNIELTDQIRVLQREKATAEQNAKDLRDFNGRAISFLRSKGFSPEAIRQQRPDAVPAEPVEGKVVELNTTGRSMEISIGSDDGLAVGQELFVYRFVPQAKYIGKVKIVSVYPDKAVADVIGSTVNGLKVQEGDNVSSTFFHTR
jgi:predicted  nucleic acid-binding Zn-ribbon protein